LNDQPAALPLEHFVDLGRLTEAGSEFVLEPKDDELAKLAAWAEVSSIEAFKATVDIKRSGRDRYRLNAVIDADLTQACVVTLEPVKDRIAKEFSRELHLVRPSRHALPETEALTVGAGDDDAPEDIDNQHYDVAGPVLEEFSLAINPYPRCPGVAFESPSDPVDRPDNPFAVLKSLKT